MIDLHHQRLERLAALCAPIHDEAPAPPPGLFGWLVSPPAPTPEQRMRAAWRRVVLLRDRASLAAIYGATLAFWLRDDAEDTDPALDFLINTVGGNTHEELASNVTEEGFGKVLELNLTSAMF